PAAEARGAMGVLWQQEENALWFGVWDVARLAVAVPRVPSLFRVCYLVCSTEGHYGVRESLVEMLEPRMNRLALTWKIDLQIECPTFSVETISKFSTPFTSIAASL